MPVRTISSLSIYSLRARARAATASRDAAPVRGEPELAISSDEGVEPLPFDAGRTGAGTAEEEVAAAADEEEDVLALLVLANCSDLMFSRSA